MLNRLTNVFAESAPKSREGRWETDARPALRLTWLARADALAFGGHRRAGGVFADLDGGAVRQTVRANLRELRIRAQPGWAAAVGGRPGARDGSAAVHGQSALPLVGRTGGPGLAQGPGSLAAFPQRAAKPGTDRRGPTADSQRTRSDVAAPRRAHGAFPRTACGGTGQDPKPGGRHRRLGGKTPPRAGNTATNSQDETQQPTWRRLWDVFSQVDHHAAGPARFAIRSSSRKSRIIIRSSRGISLSAVAEIESHPELYPGLEIDTLSWRDYPAGPCGGPSHRGSQTLDRGGSRGAEGTVCGARSVGLRSRRPLGADGFGADVRPPFARPPGPTPGRAEIGGARSSKRNSCVHPAAAAIWC